MELTEGIPPEGLTIPATVPLSVQGRRLVEAVQPFVAAKDITGLRQYLERAGWNEPALIALLTCSNVVVVRAAAWCLAYVGTMRSNLPLASVLHHDDVTAVAIAENALWSIWLRSGTPQANSALCRGIMLTNQGRYREALREFDLATLVCPGFAEAFNQRATTRFLMGDYCGAINEYRSAIALNPVHFGALAGLGHCYTALGRYSEAVDVYHRALSVHPRFDGVRQAINEVRKALNGGNGKAHC